MSRVSPFIPLKDRVEGLQQILLDRATSSTWSANPEGAALARHDYEVLREDLLEHPELAPAAPAFLRECRDLDRFWSFIKGRFAHYDERRDFIWRSFDPLFARIEGDTGTPADADIAGTLSNLSPEAVADVWRTALQRRSTDPDGAITVARTVLETVCKHILTDLNVPCDEGDDMPKLYGLTSAALSLAPDQYTEQVFKQILGGCKTVVDGLAALRNRLSDAHGRGPTRGKPSARHAELAVNLAGATATFLVQTWMSRRPAS